MKTLRIWITAAGLALAGPLFSQFGVQAGAAFGKNSFKEGTESESTKFRTGITGGIFYRVPLGETFSFQPELNWMQKGGKDSETFLGSTIDVNLILNYLEVPLYFLYTGPENSGFYAGIGPSINYGMSGTLKVNIDGESDSETIDWDEQEIRRFHIGINAQAGYSLPGGLLFNAFVSQSITNNATNESGGDARGHFLTAGLRVGYMFGASSNAKSASLKRLP